MAVVASVLACSVGITDAPQRPVLGGVYQYYAQFLGGPIVFQGTLILSDGSGGTVGGTYVLPGQCITPANATTDCFGTVTNGKVHGLDVRFDFDDSTFHHSGVMSDDGTITGLWTLQVRDTTQTPAVVQNVTGRFVATPTR